MSEHGHRTFVGTLVFLDVLDPRPDALECVQEAAGRAVGHLESEDVVTVPHPRGLVLVFPGDPEDGLFVALGLRDALDHEAASRTGFGARMSIHLGPVRILEGVAQGEGPTVGAQLAGVATPGQILASRSFYEVVSSLSAEHKALLHPVGRRRTAEGKEVDVYELGSHLEREVEVTLPTVRTPPHGAAAAPPPVQPIPLVTPVETPPAAPAPPLAPAPVIVTGGWVAGALEELGAVLARSIGPLAHTLVRRAARATQDPRALVAELAESIENGDDRRKFEDFARSWIRRSRAVGGMPATPGPPYTPGAPYTPGPPHTPGAPGAPLTPVPQQHAPSRVMAGAGRVGGGLTAEQRAVLEAALLPHLGPIARVMVDRVARDAPDWGTACQTLSGSIPDHVSREDFLRTISAPAQRRAPPRAPGKTATQIRPAATQVRPAPPPAPARGSPSRPTPAAEHPPSPMPRGSPSRPTPVAEQPQSPMPRGGPSRPVPVHAPLSPLPRGSPSRPTPAVEPQPRARGLMEDDLHRAERALSISLGPVARTLVKRAARNANTPWELFSALAAEVPEGPERERFLAAQPDV